MKIAVKIEKAQQESRYRITSPDILGVESEEVTIDKALDSYKERLSEHFALLSEYGEPLPSVKPLEAYCLENIVSPAIWLVIEIDETKYLGRSQKINVTLPELLIKQIDDYVSRTDDQKTRSGFIANASLAYLKKEKY